MQQIAIMQFYIAGAVFLLSGTMQFLFYTFANRLSYKVRIAYFKACLEKDAAFYDEFSPTQMPTKIVKETEQIRAGMGDKIAAVFQAAAMMLCAYTMSFVTGWQLACYLFLSFPVFATLGICFTAALAGGLKEYAKSYAQSAGYAEQALQAIKVV